MKILKYKKTKSNKYVLTLSNNDTIELYDNVILNNNLLLTKEIKNINKLINENNMYDAYYLALKYVEKKLRTRKELYDYLSKKYDGNIVDESIKRIEKDGYLNDELYIKSYINDQINLTNNGYYKILKDLNSKDLNEELIKEYLDNIDKKIWEDKIKKIVDKSIKTNTKYSTNYLKEKILYNLKTKGYDNNDILNVVNSLNLQEDDNILEKNYNALYNKLLKKYSGKDLELHIFNKLLSKGFKYNDIKEYINKKIPN